MFEVNQPLPFWPNRNITIDVRYVGPNWEDYYDQPTTDLNSIKEHLEIYAVYGLEVWCDKDAGTTNFYSSLKEFIFGPEGRFAFQKDMITLIIKEFEETNTLPEWYWDT